MMKYDVYLVGVGGQGLLTIAEILAEAARQDDISVNYYPSKGMAQRGGFVKAQLRFGRAYVGPAISDGGADLVIAAELSEALKAVRYLKRGGDFLLSGEEWKPTAVTLGKSPYPTISQVKEKLQNAGARLLYLDHKDFPIYQGRPAPANLYLLGAAMAFSDLGTIVNLDKVERIIREKWVRDVQINTHAFHAGIAVITAAPAGRSV
jgi:indolepyruvate ferredoxin oxidoreductase beta subunit